MNPLFDRDARASETEAQRQHAATPKSPKPTLGFRWIPIRSLAPRHRPRILAHLLCAGRARPLSALRLRGQRRADRALRGPAGLQPRRGLRHLQPSPRTGGDGPPGLHGSSPVAPPGGGVRRFGGQGIARARLRRPSVRPCGAACAQPRHRQPAGACAVREHGHAAHRAQRRRAHRARRAGVAGLGQACPRKPGIARRGHGRRPCRRH